MTSFSYHSQLLSPINNYSSQFYDATETPSTRVEHVTQNVKRKMRTGTTLDSAQSMEQETGRKRKQKKSNDSMENEKKEKEAPTEYIHVRARRGQATDSHSLAERVRREKISERMKILQSLVPGCDKVSGKALMLDEIINYVQSLQNQVEFLSMKLASINPMFYEFGVDLDALMVKPESLIMNSVPSPPLQQCSPIHPTFSPPLLDASASFFLPQGGQWPSQDNDDGLLWDSGCFH